MPAEPLAHFLAAGDLLIDRARAQLPGAFKKIAHSADLAGIQDSLQTTPALHIVFRGHELAAQLSDGSASVYRQHWMAVVVTRSAKSAKSGAGAVALAGPLADRLLAPGVITGWTPAAGCGPFTAVSPGVGSAVSDAGCLYVPLEWALVIKRI